MLAIKSSITPSVSSCSRRLLLSAAPAAKSRRCRVRVTAQTVQTVQQTPPGTVGQTPDEYKSIPRADLDPSYAQMAPANILGVGTMPIKVPRFQSDGSIKYPPQTALVLNKAKIQQIKAAAIDAQTPEFKSRFKAIKSLDSATGFNHPGGVASAAELALLKEILQGATNSNSPGATVQEAARHRLVTGKGIPAKQFQNLRDRNWRVPTDTPLTGYGGPYPMDTVCILYSGLDPVPEFAADHPGVTVPVPPTNYPSGAPLDIVGHVSFVELDSQMAIKQAMAYWAETDPAKADQHAQNAFTIIDAWVTINKGWKPDGWDRGENGPLEAGWGIACMARALEMLRGVKPGSGIAPNLNKRFVEWVKAYGLKQMKWYTDVITKKAIENGKIATYGNWHATIAEAMMSVAILSSDSKFAQGLYRDATQLFHTTVKEYIWKWGRLTPSDAFKGRYIGEITETLRDIYHSQFGLGGLLQCAEMAWQQDDDLYSSNEYALVSAMELHARIIRAWSLNDKSMLPSDYVLPNAKNDPNLPAPYQGYTYEAEQQAWVAQDGSKKVLRDGKKYLKSIKFLPCGWEVGYNHYAGRLGIPMPETAALLKMFWPEWQEWHWGSGTLTHAGTAAQLWRPGTSQVAPS
eukprot:GHUV01000382.1.p1 GENE.GHUV01000382.1~~GHUV01000382.1.p1  ORF type:complete len:631 (+),score=126.39 GHUV01000382.1:267-2159(+)